MTNDSTRIIDGYWETWGEILGNIGTSIKFEYFEGVKVKKSTTSIGNVDGFFSYSKPPPLAEDCEVKAYIRGKDRSTWGWFIVNIWF